MDVACIDLEGVLIPELWPALAAATGIAALARTTREDPDYRLLMTRRIQLLREHGLRLSDVAHHLRGLQPEPGAVDFLTSLGQRCKVMLVSDAFSQMVAPLVAQLEVHVPLLCHEFDVGKDGFVSRCLYAPRRGKEDVVMGIQARGSTVVAVGDAFNDIQMLSVADRGYLFRPSDATMRAAPHLAVVAGFHEIVEAWADSPGP